MDIDTTYLIECAIYERCINGTALENYLAEFYRIHPELFWETVVVTPEIEELDETRKEVLHALQAMYDNGIEAEDQRYAAAIKFGWDVYRCEIEKFCEINKTKLDGVIEQYRAYAAHVPC